MLAVIGRYKLLLIIMLLVILAALIWLYLAVQDGNRIPAKGVFVLGQAAGVCFPERGCGFCSR